MTSFPAVGVPARLSVVAAEGSAVCFTKKRHMRKPRTLVPIPRQLAAAIDKAAGPKQRDALCEAAGSWKDEDHSQLAEGADKWVHHMRQESAKRFERIEHQLEAE